MPLVYSVDPDLSLVTIEVFGSAAFRDFLAIFDQVLADPCYRPGMGILTDLTRLERLHLSTGEMKTLADVQISLKERIGNGDHAIVAPQLAYYGLCRMWQVFCERGSLDTHVFRHLDAALEWLGMEPMAESDPASPPRNAGPIQPEYGRESD